MKVSLVVPVYGSEKILEKSHKEFTKAIRRVTNDYEILFRIDDSPDNSKEVLENIRSRDKHVKIFSHKPNKGLGYTLRQLFKDAEGDYIIYLDADAFFSFDLGILPYLFQRIQTKDVVVASRYFKNPEIPFYRRIPSDVYFLFNYALFRINVRDVGSGFVIFKKSAIKNIDLISNGFDIHIEIFSKLKEKGYLVEEIPVNYRHWKGSSFKLFKHGPKTLYNTFSLWLKMHKYRKL